MAAFTPGNIVVYRVGTGVAGTAAVNGAAVPVFLDEYSPGGTFVQSIALPTTTSGSVHALTASSTATSEGILNLSGDGKYLLLGGFDAAVGATGVAAASGPRVVGRVAADGTIDTSTIYTATTDIRSVTSADGSSFYIGTNSTANYSTLGGSTTVSLGSLNARNIELLGTQLYYSTASAVGTFGPSGPPTSGTQTASPFTFGTAPGSNLGDFFFADLDGVAGLDTLYIVDGSNGLGKYSLVGASWMLNSRVTTSGAAAITGLEGLTASVAGTSVTLYVSNPTRILSLVDTSGFNMAMSATTLTTVVDHTNTTAFPNQAIRGVAFAPQVAVVATETISFQSAAITQAEGDSGTTAYTITLVRSAGIATATVAWAVSGAAVNAADFGGTLPSGTATFTGTSLTTTFTINVSGDQTIEPDEQFTVTLSSPSAGYQIGTPSTQTETITNDDVVGTFTIATTTDATEGGNATFTVSRTGGLGGPVDVPYAVLAGTATAADFPGGVLPSGTVRFEPGQTSATITVATLDDSIVEGDEAFTVQLSPSGQTAVTTQGTILANDPAGTVSIADVTVGEGDGTATITLTRTGGSGDVTVTYSTADGTATAGSDYTATTGSATFLGSATTATFTVPINDDALVEMAETFTISIAPGTGAPAIGTGTATVTITDNDVAGAPGTFAITPATQAVVEGGTGSTPISFSVTRINGSTGIATVPYTITFTGPSPVNAGDFAAGQTFTGSVVFADGDTAAKTITLQVQGDAVIEPNETFTVTLGTPDIGALTMQSSAVGTITNDDSAFAIASGSASEAAGAGVPLVVTRTGDLGQAATLDYAVSIAGGDTATAADFTGGILPTGTVSFAANTSSATIQVPVSNDTAIEADDTFTVTLSGAGTNQTITTAMATGTILNDDFPTLTISDPSVVEGNGTAVLRYIVTSSAPAPAGGISFDIAAADGTAAAGTDYVGRSVAGASIAAGQTSYTFDVQVTADNAPERAETVLVNLTNPQRAVIADAQGVGTIDNDDGAPAGLQPVFSANFAGFTAAGFVPNPTAAQLDSDVWRVGGLSDNSNPVYGGTYTTGDFARGVINGANDPTGGGVYSPSANAALVVQPTGTDFENGGFIEAQIINTTGFTATSFDVAFDWAFRNSGDRADALAFSYSTDGATFITVPAAAFTTPATKDASTAGIFSLQGATATLSDLLVGDGNALFLRWTHTGSTGASNRDEVGIDNVVVRAGVSDIQTLSATDISVSEGTGGTSFATFTVTRSSGTGAASIDFATADGTARAGSDYTAQAGTLSFVEGERSKTVTVALGTDGANESSETFFLNLTNAVGVTVTDAQARATIANDDTGVVAIFDVQGAGHTSPFAGLSILTGGIVTAINANSYWIQDAAGDGLFATSDAIQVFVGAAPTGVLVGDRVTVAGTVTEFTPATGALTVTQLTAPILTVLENNVARPAAVLIGIDGVLPPTEVIDDDRLTSFDPTTDGLDFYEALEGMYVTVQSPLVVAPSDGRITFVVASGGIGATGINERGGITLSAGDDAPERIQIFADSTLLPGYTPNHTLGDILGNVTGILTYFTYPEILPTQAITVTTDKVTTQEVSALRGDLDHLLVASFNIENADPTDPQAKFDAIGAEVVTNLNRPDIIGLQEVQDADGAGAGTNLSGQATADKMIAAIVAAGGPAYLYIEIAPATANTSGGEPGGNIRNGYLYNPDRVSYLAGSAVLVPGSAFNGTRSPLAANFVFNGQTVTLIDTHSTSRGGSDLSFGANQPPVQAGDSARTAQATAIKTYIDGLQSANPDAHVVTLGDFNGYYYETALSTLTNDGKLTNLYTLLPVAERYSYLFDGAVQAFDNIIVSNNLLDGTQFDVVHVNAEQVVQPITDHDQALASIYIPRPNVAPTDLTIDNASVAENAAAGTLVGTVRGVDMAGDTLSYSLVDSFGGLFAINNATGDLTTTTPFNFEAIQSASVTARVTDSGGLTYDEAISVTITNVNEAPTDLTISNSTVAENAAAGTVVGTVTGTDPEGGPFTFSLSSNPGERFAINATTGVVTTTAALDFETLASAAITARVTDSAGLSVDKALTIAVTNVNETPTDLTISNSSVAENAAAGTVVGTVTGTDPEGGPFTFSLSSNPGGRFAINATTGVVTTTAALDFETLASAAITAQVTDSAGLSVDKALTIAVTNVNEAPGAVSISNAVVTENASAGTVIGTLAAVDPDAGDSLTFALATADARFRVENNQLVVAAGAVIDYETQTSIPLSFTATDRGGLSTTTALSISVRDVSESVAPGTSGNDMISGSAGADSINAGDGNDTVNGGPGADTITLGAGADTVRALLSEILGDTITDFGKEDRLLITSSDIHRSDFTVTGSGASTLVTFAGGGTLALPGGLAGGDLMVAHSGSDSVVTFQSYLATLAENTAVSASAINGIVNQAYLSGDTSTSFIVNVEAMSGASFSNTLGVYEIDRVTGVISDVRIIATNVKTANGPISVNGVEVGHDLGFFLVQNGANQLSSAVLQSSALSIVAEGGHLALANGGTAIAGANTFFSHSAAANVDGAEHALSGVSANGLGDIRIGFEDLSRNGTQSDNDFQDVVLTVEAVNMLHPLAAQPVLHG